MADRLRILGELITVLERRESALLEWGFFDVAHTSDELIELFSNDPHWGRAFREFAEGSEELFVDNLAESRLLYRIDNGYPRRYRSRFAESIRLFARLKQRFRSEDWLHAPELVSQVRLHLAARKFPKRDKEVQQVWEAVAPVTWLQPVQQRILHLLMSGDPPLRLAAFQVRAIVRILGHYRGAVDTTGTVVTAGTGGGKTKSFYIPALMGIAADVSREPAFATKVLALYPRNVLLIDQLSEAASQISIINGEALLKRPLSVGALIGEVPYNADFEAYPPNRWALTKWPQARFQKGRLVPYLCDPKSGERLVWTDTDRLSGTSTLRRDTQNGEVVFPDGTVCLTRDAIANRPPDIFLTSIEMLNKELSSEIGRSVLGFGSTASKLRMVLLDEVHTYEGVTGAQVPWILRRLNHWVRPDRRDRQIHFVGLSATLRDAQSHLAKLTGVLETKIEEITPQDTTEELSIEGQEYNVVLKSHPGSGAGVLSTSIQAAMLGSRLLSPAAGRPYGNGLTEASHFFGSKLFCFTDNLDVINRWLPDLKNAEQTLRLARLRTPHANDGPMDAAGQVWKLPQLLGHNLNSRLTVDRISSQDPGIDSTADIVIATSSLEVGYDDKRVGMVLQHKAPRSVASFLQRKGRAGRPQGMRPWTVVVLSDHGRDRWAFRDSEQLFDPVLQPLSLPVFNPYLMRIQATWFLVDWISLKIGASSPSLYLTRQNYRRDDAEQLVENLLGLPEAREELTKSMEAWVRGRGGGLQVVDAASIVNSLLWEPPRAVLRHVVPDLKKFIDTGYAGSGRRNRLLPRFLPATTWDILDAQDVELRLDDDHSELIDAGKALYETVPGRVSRRFVVDPRAPSKWPRFSARLIESPQPTMCIDQACDEWIRNDECAGFVLFQPTQMAFADVPRNVKNSSNAQWDWELAVKRLGIGSPVALHGLLDRLFRDAQAWLHRDQTPVQTFWFARRFRYEIHLEKDEVRRGVVEICAPQGVATVSKTVIGYARTVDCIQLVFRDEWIQGLPVLQGNAIQEMRAAFFRYLASRSTVLTSRASPFAISNLCASALGMVVSTALKNRVGLEAAWFAIPDKPKAAAKVMQTILSVDGDETDENRTLSNIIDLWETPEVLDEIGTLIQVLWTTLDDQFTKWLQDTFVETIRAATEEAVRLVLPELTEGSIKVASLVEEGVVSIVILETDPGGVGGIERLLLEIKNEPEHFAKAFEWVLSVCPSESISSTILSALSTAQERYSEMRSVFDEIRRATDYHSLDSARQVLISTLLRNDLPATRRHVTSLLSKALGPGTNQETDRWMVRLSGARLKASRRISFAVDCRSFAYWISKVPSADSLMRSTLRKIVFSEPDETQVYQAFLRLTIESCVDSCPECLGAKVGLFGHVPSRRLASLWLGATSIQVIEIDDCEAWKKELKASLRNGTRFRLIHRSDQRTMVARTVAALMTSEVDRGYHSCPFRISGVRRKSGKWETDLEVDTWEQN